MALVHFTPHLRTFFDLPDAVPVKADTLGALLDDLDARWPGLAFYIQDEQGCLRQHVVVWVDGKAARQVPARDVPVGTDATVHILQALSGG